MNTTSLRPLVHRLVGLVGADAPGDLADSDLLERFRTGREEAAFTLLVQRHGPAVLGVCRRLLGNSADADDVFQATFLVLLRKADTIRKRASLASWLHGVARRIAFQVRDRRTPTPPLPELSAQGHEPVEELSRREVEELLDEEIGRLPEYYRVPLILCGLEGLSCAQAAQALGWPKSTVSHRVHRAQDLLRDRLLRRGVVASAALLATALASEAATVPALLTLRTVRLAAQVLTGEAPAAAPALVLARGVRIGLAPSVRLLALTLTALLGLAAAGAGLLAGPREQPQALPVTQASTRTDPTAPKDRTDAEGFPLPAEAIARVGSARLRHGRWLREVAYSPDGKLLASSGGKLVRLWDTATGKLLHEFPLTEERGTPDACFTADGKTIVLLDDQTCRWLDVQTGKETRAWSVPELPAPGCSTFAPHGEALVVADTTLGKDLVVYELPSGKERFRKSAGENATWNWRLIVSADGSTLAALHGTAGKNVVRFFQMADGKPLGEIDPENAWGQLMLSADGKRLAGANFPKNLCVWEVPSGKPVFKTEPAINAISALRFTPDGKGLVVGTQDLDAVLLDAATGKELHRFRTHPSSLGLAVTSDSKTLAIGTVGGAISQWDLATGKLLPASTSPVAGVYQVNFDRDSRLLWITDAGLRALDWRTGREGRRLAVPHEGANGLLAWSPDRSRIAGNNKDKKLAIWDAETGKQLCEIPNAGIGWFGRTFSPDGRTLYTAAWNGPIRAWDTATGRELPAFDTGTHLTRSLAVSPDGRWLAAADHPQAAGAPARDVTVWDLKQGREAYHLPPPPEPARAWDLTFSPDSQYLAATGGSRNYTSTTDHSGFVQVWDLGTGKPRMTRAGLAGCGMNVRFSADGRLLATGTGDNLVHVWEAATGSERHRFTGHTNTVYSVAFSADGKFLAASSDDAPVYIWDVTGTYDRPTLGTPFAREEEDRLWKALAEPDAAAAFQAMRQLLTRPGPAVAFLSRRLRPAVEAQNKTLEAQVRALDADDFATRQRAVEELKKAGEQAEPLLRQALKNNPSAETRRQIEMLLEAFENVTPEQIRQLRAVEVLEHLATDDARKLLDKLAGGARDALLTREAKAARERLSRQ